MKKILALIASAATILASVAILPAHAAINILQAPVSLVASPISLTKNSAQTALFSFNLKATGGETLSNVAVLVDKANASTTVSGSHLASLSLYRDDGSGVFNPAAINLVGMQPSVNVGTTTEITPSAVTAPNGKFYVSLATSGTWSDAAPADSVIVTLPANAIVTSTSSPVTTQVTTAAITADTTGPQLLSAAAQNTGGTGLKEAGDSVALTFSEATNKPAITGSNINNEFSLNNGHSFLDSAGNLAGANWSSDGTTLTIVLSGSASSTIATVSLGDTVTLASTNNINDGVGNQAQGSAAIAGSFGSQNQPAISTSLSATSTMLGMPVHDSATLNGATTNASGIVTYNVFSGTMCSGTPVFTDTENVTNGVALSSKDFTAAATGTYNWQASYSGDANNASAISGCGTETLTVTQTSPPVQNGDCGANGLINGRIYNLQGTDNFYIAADCLLKPFKGEAIEHARGKKFRNIITLSSVDGLLAPQKSKEDNDSDDNDQDDDGGNSVGIQSSASVQAQGHFSVHLSRHDD